MLTSSVQNVSFVRLGISHRYLSIGGRTFNVDTGFDWDFNFNGTLEKSENDRTQVHRLEQPPLSPMQVALCEVKRPNESAEESEERDLVLRIKYNPCSRLMTLLDFRRREVLLFEMINENRILFKLKGTDNQSYWTLMNTAGFILDMPQKMKETLAMKDWNSLQVKSISRKPSLFGSEYNFAAIEEDSDDSMDADEINAAGNDKGM